jgi:hypothetical protein
VNSFFIAWLLGTIVTSYWKLLSYNTSTWKEVDGVYSRFQTCVWGRGREYVKINIWLNLNCGAIVLLRTRDVGSNCLREIVGNSTYLINGSAVLINDSEWSLKWSVSVCCDSYGAHYHSTVLVLSYLQGWALLEGLPTATEELPRILCNLKG